MLVFVSTGNNFAPFLVVRSEMMVNGSGWEIKETSSNSSRVCRIYLQWTLLFFPTKFWVEYQDSQGPMALGDNRSSEEINRWDKVHINALLSTELNSDEK